uniref:Coat protein n=1 Tax=Haemonchus placei TaxID=6290 RepID=A0A0N4WZ37_HAEPC
LPSASFRRTSFTSTESASLTVAVDNCLTSAATLNYHKITRKSALNEGTL